MDGAGGESWVSSLLYKRNCTSATYCRVRVQAQHIVVLAELCNIDWMKLYLTILTGGKVGGTTQIMEVDQNFLRKVHILSKSVLRLKIIILSKEGEGRTFASQ